MKSVLNYRGGGRVKKYLAIFSFIALCFAFSCQKENQNNLTFDKLPKTSEAKIYFDQLGKDIYPLSLK